MNIGMHAVYETSFEEAIRLAGQHGFDYVQFDLNCPQFYVDGLSDAQVASLGRTAEDHGVAITFHAPGDHIGLFTDHADIRAGMLEHFRKILNVAGMLHSHHVTFHPLSPPSFRRADTGAAEWERIHSDYFSQILRENLEALDRMSSGPLICVENHKFDATARAVLESLLGTGRRMALTYDIAKSMTNPQIPDPEQQRFFEIHSRFVQEVHLHDMNESHSHLVPGDGAIDFRRFASLLCRKTPWVTIEVRPVELALRGKKWLEGLRQRHP